MYTWGDIASGFEESHVLWLLIHRDFSQRRSIQIKQIQNVARYFKILNFARSFASEGGWGAVEKRVNIDGDESRLVKDKR